MCRAFLTLTLFSFRNTVSAVNNTNELGPVKVMTFLANETTITLGNLNSSMLYKFYLSAHTIKGSGPIITEEAFTVMDTTRTQPTLETGKGPTEPPHPTSPITQSPHPPLHKVPPVGPAFGKVNTSMLEDGAVISWDYFGHHKNVYVEYIIENSKASLCIHCHLKTPVHELN
ncbi:Neuronal cell adhesion molecule [Liparis tanakae]|uniref:Neuronal cell adhesion molecule n=1 Tax=Liparis tanakae TaxID=230148 RepID=A0A4Z2I994_9TELE|nr:Neuronal cell adhesion molecule [Liparis tanakae]